MDCLPALLRVTTAVLELTERAQAGDEEAARQLSVLATMLDPGDAKKRDRLSGPSSPS